MPFGPDPSRGPIGDGSHILESDDEETDPDWVYEAEMERRYEEAHEE